MTTCSVPERTSATCGNSQGSVPASGLRSVDHRAPTPKVTSVTLTPSSSAAFFEIAPCVSGVAEPRWAFCAPNAPSHDAVWPAVGYLYEQSTSR